MNTSRVFGLLRPCQPVNLVQKWLSTKWTHPGSLANSDDNIFYEDAIEEKLNANGAFPTPPHGEHRRRKSARREIIVQHRKFVKRKIIEKKEKAFYGEKQPSLLTWAAKEQIRYLNKDDPVYWTPDMLAQSFPVSSEVITKILKNNRQLPHDEEFIMKHDQQVYMNWLKLKQAKKDLIEGRPVDPQFRSVVESDQLNLMKNASGCLALPVPVSGYLTQEALAERRRPRTKGEFSAILEDYQMQKEDIRQKKEVKHIEIEDANYVALLTDISGTNVEEDIDEERLYEDEELFYDEYDDNLPNNPNKHRDNGESLYHNRKTDNVSERQKVRDSKSIKSFSPRYREQDQSEGYDKFEYRRSYDKKGVDFQKSIARWVKESSEHLEKNQEKGKKN